MNPSPLAGDDIGYIRKDTAEAGIYYTSGRRGPRGAIRAASWSPDGSHVVFTRSADIPRRNTGTIPAFSRNSRLRIDPLRTSAFIQFVGQEFVTASAPSANPRGASLNVTNVETGQGRRSIRTRTGTYCQADGRPPATGSFLPLAGLRRFLKASIPNF